MQKKEVHTRNHEEEKVYEIVVVLFYFDSNERTFCQLMY